MFNSMMNHGMNGNFSIQQHVDPNSVLVPEFGRRVSPGVSMGGHDNMFHFGADSDNEDDDENMMDQSIIMQNDFAQVGDPTLDLNSGLQWEPNMAEFHNIHRGPGEGKQVRIGGTEMVHSPGEWGSSLLSRTHGSAASISDIRNRDSDPRRQKMPRTTSTSCIGQQPIF